MRILFVSFLIALISSVFAQSCGPAQCYSGCTDARVPLDLIFLIDVSGSMQEEISGVRNGLTQFVSDLLSKSVIPSFTVILFGNKYNEAPMLLNAETSFSKFKLTMDSITVDGGWEPSLETIRRACNAASSTSNYNINFRAGSKKVIIMLTDEDSDPAYYSSNRFQSSGNDGRESCPSYTSTSWSQYQAEIDSTAKAILALGATTYLLVDVDTSSPFRTSQTCLTTRQFGDITQQVQSADFKTFDLVATRNNIRNGPYPNNLQAQLLNAGKLCRVFDVDSADEPNLVKNFFEAITIDVSSCDPCMQYNCTNNKCVPPVNICGCDGKPNSGKTLDPFGGCCYPNERDCSGQCFGTNTYDSCGVCGKSLSALCKKDCGDRFYLTSKPSTNYITPDNLKPDTAGYLLSNTDIYNAFASPTGNLRSIDAVQNQFNQFGRFEGRIVCEFDANRYATQYGVNVADAKNHWLNNLLENTALNTKNEAHCVDGSRKKITSYDLDACGQCVQLIDLPPYCVKDCSGNLRTSLASSYFYDNCGQCVAPGTNPNANKDYCGICFGGNSTMNQCGICFGSKALDKCNNPVCLGKTCDKNCDGVSEVVLTKELDPCGYCVLIGTLSPNCLTDCNGKFYRVNATSLYKVDECGVCVVSSIGRSPDCIQDCSGKWNGTAYYDSCGQCIDGVEDYTCLQDCKGNFYRQGKDVPIYTVDDCNECNTLSDRNKLKDKCGVCVTKPFYNSTTDCTPDCKGIWTLPTDPTRSRGDFCGDCWFYNQTDFFNYRMDDCGICHSSRDDPAWNANIAQDPFGNKCACFFSPNVCTTPEGRSYEYCLDCPLVLECPFGGTKDDCGHCPDHVMYNKKDNCGLCCDPPALPCNVDVDDCGKCFGFNQDKQTNLCHICDASKCVVDCKGIPNGTAVIGCDGVCGSNAKCLTCGDGITSPEIGETCDLGNGKNVKGSGCYNCQTERAKATGAIAGGVIGGVAAAAFLGLSGFVAYKYAEKSGLIGKAGQTLDLSASNSNPLYKTDTSVQQNPLYGDS